MTTARYVLFLTAGWVLAQNSPPRYKAIWEPVNFKGDVKLFDIHFTDEQTGWVVGGASEMAGGVILHTKDAGLTWEVQYGDPNPATVP